MANDTSDTTEAKPVVELTGRDGNAFAIIAACRRAARGAGWDTARWQAVQADMTGGDYDHLLVVAMTHFDVE